MKTTIIIIAVLALIVIFDFWSMSFFEKELTFYNEIINSILKDIDNENYDTLDKDMEDLVAHWEEHIFIWNIMCDHNEVETLTMLFHTSNTHIQAKMYEEAITGLTELKYNLEFSSMRYVFILVNIL